MPSSSAKQHRFMAAIAHNPSFAKKVGVSQSVGKDFSAADKGKTFNKGGMMKTRKFATAGFVDDSDMDGEGNTRSKYEIDPDSRRAHGLYDAAPKKAAAKAKPKPAIRKSSEDIAAENRDERNSSGFKAYLGPNERADKIIEDMRSATKAADFKARAEETNARQKKLSENLASRKTYTYKKGGEMKESKGMMKKEVAFMQKKGAPKSMIKHEKAEMGMAKYAKGGGIESRGKTKGTMVRMATGGSVGSASRRADGIAQRGKTRC